MKWACYGVAAFLATGAWCSDSWLQACTSFLITKSASADGSTMITYAADSHTLYGELYYTPRGKHLPGTMLNIYEWDTGKFLGQIKQISETYAVVGNMNEHQLAISETTWGGREELQDPKGIMDYGSLIYVTLQRAKTAREAIAVMDQLVTEYGYYSTGESFSIADPNEVWIYEIIGKGAKEKGAVWVARKIPDGYISAHANAARIRQFPLDDPDTLYAKDIITFARKMGYFTGEDKDFSFAEAYAPVDYGALRFCDSRVWCMYKRTAPTLSLPADWVKGVDGAEPLPLWIKPEKKISAHDVIGLMRDHFEGTELDMTQDIGAGPYDLPYRWRPLTWKVADQEYLNERATSTQQTGFSFVTQSRGWLPDSIGGLLWFGVDDTYSTVYMPIYCSINKIPHCLAVGTGSFKQFSWESAFWVFNFVSNYSYLRYRDMIKDIQVVQRELEAGFMADQPHIEEAALALYQQSPRLATDYLTEHSNRAVETTVTRWKNLGEQLIFKYLDGNVKDELGNVTHPGYPESWYKKVAAAAGQHLMVSKLKSEEQAEAQKKMLEAQQRQELLDAIRHLLEVRKIKLTSDQEVKIQQMEKIDQLEKWLLKAATAESAEEVIETTVE